jgi:hypothetical protein
MLQLERVYLLAHAGETRDLAVRVGKPEVVSQREVTVLAEILWPEGTWSLRVGGSDMFQAVLLAMQAIAINLYTSAAHSERRLSFPGQRGGYGLPLMPGVTDLYEGDDIATFVTGHWSTTTR